jgi:DeoR/GlpR family transcriptional regulator of sugar metabolism
LEQLSRALSSSETLNHRQQAVLSHLIRHPHPGVTVVGHSKSHGVSYLTARKDLQDMAPDLLRRRRIGKTDHYTPTEHFQRRLMGDEKGSS